MAASEPLRLPLILFNRLKHCAFMSRALRFMRDSIPRISRLQAHNRAMPLLYQERANAVLRSWLNRRSESQTNSYCLPLPRWRTFIQAQS